MLILLVSLAFVGSVLLASSTYLLLDSAGAISVGHVLHSIGGKLLTLAAAVGSFLLIDKVFLPYLDIHEVFFGLGRWSKAGEDVIRAAVIRGWFIAFAAIVLAFAFGGAH